jgi:hypothetical protein
LFGLRRQGIPETFSPARPTRPPPSFAFSAKTTVLEGVTGNSQHCRSVVHFSAKNVNRIRKALPEIPTLSGAYYRRFFHKTLMRNVDFFEKRAIIINK